MDFQESRHDPAEHLALEDKIVVATKSAERPNEAEARMEFEVVGIVRDSDSTTDYGVCYNKEADEFIVTDESGELLADQTLAQGILDGFLSEQAESAEGEK